MSTRYALISAFIAVSSCTFLNSCEGNTSEPDSEERWIWDNEDGDGSDDATSHYPKADGVFRIATYNVGSFSKYMTNSTEMVASMLMELDPDAVGLNELDSINTRHKVNQVQALASAMGGLNYYFGRAMAYKSGAYGNGAVTRDKIINRYTVALGQGDGAEQRSLAVIETERYVYGSAHLDHKSENARLMQISEIKNWADTRYYDSGKPVFFGGDMNAGPDTQTISCIKDTWDMLSSTALTYNSSTPSNCIDYIFHYKHSAPVQVIATDVPTVFNNGDVTKASDHLPVYVDVKF